MEEHDRVESFWSRSPWRRALAGLVLAAAAVALIAVFQYTGKHKSFVRYGCEIPASDAMLNAIHAVNIVHPVGVAAQTEEPFHSARFLLSQTGNIVLIEAVAKADVVCSSPAVS